LLVAGWDHDFEVAQEDAELAVDCFRILRRTCARYRVDFTYRRMSDRGSRLRYLLTYDLRSQSLALAMGEFAVEMRAVSVLQRNRRRRRLPLRLLRDVAWTAVDAPIEELLAEAGKVCPAAVPTVARLLTDFQMIWAGYEAGTVPSAEFLEALHSLITNLALTLVPGACDRDPFPKLVEQLHLRSELEQALKQMNRGRVAVKHRGARRDADQHVEDGIQAVYSTVQTLTGVYPDPASPQVIQIGGDPDVVFRMPPMFWRSGEPRVVRC
jgi:hypothetical protein